MNVTINEKTKIPLLLVLGAIPTLATFVFWSTVIYSRTEAQAMVNEKQIKIDEKQNDKIESIMTLLVDIRTSQARLETIIKQGR